MKTCSTAFASVLLTLCLVLGSAQAEEIPMPEWTEGNQVSVHYDPLPIYTAIKRLLASAKESIRFDFYIFYGPHAEAMTNILIEKAREGVRVDVILDAHLGAPGSMHTKSKRLFNKMKQAKLPTLRTYLSPNHTLPRQFRNIDHNKLVVVDDEVVMTGGMNIGEHFTNYNDIMVEVRGPVARQAAELFDRDLTITAAQAKRKTKEQLFPTHPIVPGDDEVVEAFWKKYADAETSAIRLASTGLGRIHGYQVLMRRIATATTSIDVQLSEFNGETFVDALIAAHRRGVKVRALVDPDDNIGDFAPVGHNLDGVINARSTVRLIDAGVPFKFFGLSDRYSRSHMKMSVFDGKLVSVGATNWSDGIVGNTETNFEVVGGAGARVMKKQFDYYWEQATPARKPTKLVRKINDALYALGFFSGNPRIIPPTRKELPHFSEPELALLKVGIALLPRLMD